MLTVPKGTKLTNILLELNVILLSVWRETNSCKEALYQAYTEKTQFFHFMVCSKMKPTDIFLNNHNAESVLSYNFGLRPKLWITISIYSA